MADDREQPEDPVKAPPATDPDWREKIETARKAREMGKELRKDKPSSFRRAVGRSEGQAAW